MNRTGVPDVLLTVGPGEFGVEGFMGGVRGRRDVDALGVNADYYGLVAICGGNSLNGRLALRLGVVGIVLLCGNNGVRADTDLVCAGLDREQERASQSRGPWYHECRHQWSMARRLCWTSVARSPALADLVLAYLGKK